MTLNEKKSDFAMRRGCMKLAIFGAALSLAGLTTVSAQIVKAPRYQGNATVPAPVQQINLPPLPPAITPHGVVVENVVARINDQIISRSDVDRSEEQLQQESAQQNLSPAEYGTRQHDLLRDMIDQQLLLSKAKELGLTADAEVVRRLDEIRKQNKLESMEDLEKAARQQGVNFEDFKAQIRNQILTQQVVRDEVGRRLQMTQAEEAKYYEEHKKDFDQPEQVRLSEILVPLADTATPAEIAQAETKANGLKAEITKGQDFADVAKKSSGGPTAAQGGELGLFKRGALAKVIEDQTFSLAPGETTPPIRTRQGFVILKVTEHVQSGPAPLKDVEPQVQEALYMGAMQPALRAYLTKLRENAYVDIQPGFVDSGASSKETKPVFTAYAPPPVKKKKEKNRARFDRGAGRYTTASAPVKPVVSSPDTTGGRTLTGADAQPVVTTKTDQNTGLAVLPASSAKPGKRQKGIKREKVRFGQAPRNALPDNTTIASNASEPAAATVAGSGAGAAVAPGAVMASDSNSLSSTGALAEPADNPLDAKAAPKTKTRFSARAQEHKEKKIAKIDAKKREKEAAKPAPITDEEKAASQTQAAPLGLAGDTGKKPKKAKKVKGTPKQRLEDKKKEAPAPPPEIAPTANPALAPTAVTGTGKPGDATPAPAPTPAPEPPAGTPAPPQSE